MKINSFKMVFCLGMFAVLLQQMAYAQKVPQPLRVGVSLQIKSITPQKLAYAKSVGISSIEAGLPALVDKQTLEFTMSDEEITTLMKQVRKAADDAGIEIWSVHMPYSQFIDISLADEAQRQKVIAMHEKILDFCRILKPKVVLFHPSWFLNLNERDARKSQLVKSVAELNTKVKSINAIMVVENMLGPKLLLGNGQREGPLCRTVEETQEMMGRFPKDVYSAIDMNHIAHPENLIRAMGPRLKSLHVSDGDGIEERHYFPCSGQGQNNWNDIQVALTEAGYKGPFMFESAYKDLKDIKECYTTLYNNFIAQKKSQL